MTRFLAPLALLLPLSGTALAASEFDPSADPAALASAFVKTDRLAMLASMKRAAIAQFRVEFAVENDAKASSSGTTGWSSSQSDIKLVGVTDEARQLIADQLHDKLVQDLAATGLEVVPHAVVRETEGYKSLGPVMRSGQEPLGTRTGKSVFVGARAMPYYLTNDDRHLGLGTTLGAFSTTQPQNIEPTIAKALNAAVFRVTVFVAFADQSTSGGLFNIGSSVKTSARLAIVPALTQFLIVMPDGRARVYLNDTILLGGDALVMKETTTTGEKATQAVANLVTGLLAGGGRSLAHYEASTTPDAYAAVVTRYGLALEAAMMSAMRPALGVTPAPAAPTDPPKAASAPPS